MLRAAVPDQRVKVTPIFFIRDLVFLLIALTYLLVHLCVVNYINLYSGLGFFIIYAIYVVTVVVTNKRESSRVRAQDVGEIDDHGY